MRAETMDAGLPREHVHHELGRLCDGESTKEDLHGPGPNASSDDRSNRESEWVSELVDEPGRVSRVTERGEERDGSIAGAERQKVAENRTQHRLIDGRSAF